MNDMSLPEHIEVSPELLSQAISPGMVIVGEPDATGAIKAIDVASEQVAHELGKRIAHSGGTAYLAEADVRLFKAYRPAKPMEDHWL